MTDKVTSPGSWGTPSSGNSLVMTSATSWSCAFSTFPNRPVVTNGTIAGLFNAAPKALNRESADASGGTR